MNTATKLSAFAAGLALTFAAAAGAGAVVGPIRSTAPGTAQPGHAQNDAASPRESPRPTATSSPLQHARGLMVLEEGYTLALANESAAAGSQVPLSLTILGPDGGPVTRYQTTLEQDAHLTVVRRDMAGYQHVHPFLSSDGTWGAGLDLDPGQWRVFAEFTPLGFDRPLTLGADLAVGGDYIPQPLAEPAAIDEVDGYEVHLQGTLIPGRASKLTLTVTKDGQPVTDLQTYLGSYGHLVALRDGDLAYLHMHPESPTGARPAQPGPDISFYALAPSAGSYGLFLDLRHADVVRTAQFTVRTEDAAQRADAHRTTGPNDPQGR